MFHASLYAGHLCQDRELVLMQGVHLEFAVGLLASEPWLHVPQRWSHQGEHVLVAALDVL